MARAERSPDSSSELWIRCDIAGNETSSTSDATNSRRQRHSLARCMCWDDLARRETRGRAGSPPARHRHAARLESRPTP